MPNKKLIFNFFCPLITMIVISMAWTLMLIKKLIVAQWFDLFHFKWEYKFQIILLFLYLSQMISIWERKKIIFKDMFVF